MKLSVVIPCRNEEAYITGCLESVLRAADVAGADASIYVVDGKSDDGTRGRIEAVSNRHPNVHLIVNHLQLTPYAFNLGIHADPDFEYLLICGARHILSDNYISESVRTLTENPEIWCVGGTVENVFVNSFSEIVAAAMATSFGMGIGNFRVKGSSGFVDTIGTPVYPAHVFKEIGYFDEELLRNQDDEFNYRVTQAGGKIYLNRLMSVQYVVRGHLTGLQKQMSQYGYWKVFVNRKHRAVTTMRQLVPPAFVLFLFLVPFAFMVHPYAGAVFAAVLIVYLLLCLLFGFRKGTGFSESMRIAAIFPVLHLSYGFGYLAGTLHFLILRRQPARSASALSR